MKYLNNLILFIFFVSNLMAQNAGPAGIGTTDGASSLQLWLNAGAISASDGANVASWNDISGYNHHLSQGNTTYQPVYRSSGINGLPGLEFSGYDGSSGEFMEDGDAENYLNNSNGITVVSIIKSDLTNTDAGFLSTELPDGSDDLLGIRYDANGSTGGGTNVIKIGVSSTGGDMQNESGNNTQSLLPQMLIAGWTSGSGISLFINGSEDIPTSASSTRSGMMNNTNRLVIGKGPKDQNNNEGWDGLISEILIYNQQLNAAQRTILENYYGLKYNLSIGNDVFSESAYLTDITGIGTVDGTVAHTSSEGNGGGILLREYNSTLDEPNEFIFAAHEGIPASEVTSDLPALTLPDALTGRSSRVWYIDRTEGTSSEVSLGFNLSETGLSTGTDHQIYYLLYRSGTSGNFSLVPGAVGIASNGTVWVNVTDANLQDGYYTLARSNQTGRTWYSYNSGSWDNWQTWSLEAGGADIVNPNNLTPTTSPTASVDKVVILSPYKVTLTANGKSNAALEVRSGELDFGTTTGHKFDKISGTGTILLQGDNFPSGDASQFVASAGGTVEFYGTSRSLALNRTYNHIVVKMNSAADVLTLLSDYTLNGNLTIERGNLRINDDTQTNVLTLDIAGDLTVEPGTFMSVGIGNTASGYSIQNGPMPSTGNYHGIFHQVRIGGNMTNEGNVRFTNLNAPVYNEFTATGAATVTFYGSSNALVSMDNTTDFYNLIVDKGADQTFVLEINTPDPANFALYGPNSAGRDDSNPFTNINPEVRKALWIRNGTLKLTGYVTMPSLTEGNQQGGHGDFPIPANGRLWLASPGVKVYTSALTTASGLIPGTTGISNSSGHKALSVLGTLQVDAGYLSTRNSAGIILWASATANVALNGGITDVATFRNSNTGDGITSFIMTGGYLFVRGNEQPTETISPYGTNISFTANADGGGEISGSYPVFGMVDANSVFQMSGGTIFVNDGSGNNGFNSNGIAILADDANHSVTGGTIHVKVDGNTNFDIISNGELYNLILTRLNGSNTVRVFMGSELTLNGDLTVNANTELIARREWGSFNGPSYNLQVARAFTINNDADYRPRGNTTTLLTTYTTGLAMRNSNQEFFNLTIKENPNVSSTRKQFTGSNGTVTVHNNFRMESGQFNFSNSNKDLLVKGNIFNAGTITTDAVADTGAVVLANRGIVTAINLTNAGSHTSVPAITISGGGGTGATAVPVFSGVPAGGNALPLEGIIVTNSGTGYTSAPTITISSGGASATATVNSGHEIDGDGTGIFANLEINEPHPANVAEEITTLEADVTVTGMLSLTKGILDLTTYRLTLEGILSGENQNDYSETNLIRMEGNHADGGLRRYISANGTYLYPIGSYNSTDGANRYTWAKATISNFSDDGYLAINNVPKKLPTLSAPSNPNDEKYLVYYWRLRHNDFTLLPNVTHQFMSYQDDYSENNINPFELGKIVNMARYSDSDDNLGDLDQDNPSNDFHLLDYSTVKTLEEGEFTAGHKNLFQGNIEVFYSRAGSIDWDNGLDWQNGNNWSFTPHNATFDISTRPPAGDYPGPGDIAVIGYGDNGNSFNNGDDGIHVMGTRNNTIEVAEIRFNDTAGIWDPRLVIAENATVTGGIITGNGTLYINMTPGNYPVIESDVSDFAGNTSSTFNFKMNSDGNYEIPAYAEIYPRVRFEAGSGGGIRNRIAYFTQDIEITSDLRIDWGAVFEVRTNTSVADEIRLGDGSSSGRLQFSETNAVTIEAGELRLRNEGNNSVLVSGNNNLEHRMIINGSITQTNGTIDLFTNNTGGNNVILELASATSDDSLFVSGGNVPSLYKLDVNLGASQSNTFTVESEISIGGPADGNSTEKALLLRNGTLILDHADIDITLSSGGEDFYIPSDAGLFVNQGIARVTTAGSNGIFLDGLLEIRASGANQGQVILDGGPGSDNYLMYSSSGNAELIVAEGKLTIGSQLRSTTLNKQGVLDFTMTNNGSLSSTTAQVLVGLRGAPENSRGVFEIMNPGSRFRIYNGELIIIRGHDTPGARASVYLDPETVTLSDWGFLQFGDPVNNPAGSTQTLNSTAELGRVNIDGNTSVQLLTNHATINGDFTIAAGSSFDGNNLNLTLTDDFSNAGTENLHTDSLIFSGNDQNIDGNFSTRHLVVNPSTALTLTGATSQVTATGNLYLNTGIFQDGGKTILVQGNVTNNAAHASSGSGRIKMAGSTLQTLSGNGQLGNFELDNTSGLRMQGNQSLNGNLYLTNGIFNIQYHQLELSTTSVIIGSGFNSTKMIANDGAFGDLGLKKNIPAGVYTFTYPVGIISGSDNKYTPVHFNITANSNNGSISVHPVNQAHMTATGTDVLQYYWNMQSTGLNGFEGTVAMRYLDSDVTGTEANYISAWLTGGDAWAKFPVETVFEAEDSIEFGFVGEDNISGDYTAGIDAHIPADIPVFTTISSGNWSDPNIWKRSDGLPVSAGGPNGFIVDIQAGHTVTMDRYRILSYRTTLNGRLQVGTEVGHNMGTITGSGTLAMVANKLPVGIYTNFFSCSGGTIEYGGNSDYTISNRYHTFRKMVITGSGNKTIPPMASSTYLYVCDTLLIENPATLESESALYLRGDFIKENGATYLNDYNTLFRGMQDQTLSGNFTGTNAIEKLYMWNTGYDVMKTNGDLEVSKILTLNGGILNMNGLSLSSTSASSGAVIPSAGTAQSYVQGLFSRRLGSSTATVNFATGGNNLWKPLALVTPNTPGTADYWTVEYFDNNPGADGYDPESFDDPTLTQVSLVEYWTLKGPSGGSAKIQLPLKGSSDVAAISSNLDDLRVVKWNNALDKWEIVGGSSNISGTVANGSVTTEIAITMDGTTGIYTLATIETVIVPTVQFATTAVEGCQGSAASLTVTLTGDASATTYTFTFEDDLGNTFTETVNPAVNSYTFTVSPAATRIYSLTSIEDNNAIEGIVYGSHAVVTVYPNPLPFNVSGTGSYCASEEIAVSLSNSQTGYNYELFLNGITTNRIAGGTDGSPVSFGSITTSGAYTIEAYNSASISCRTNMTGTANITIAPAPSAVLALANPAADTLCEGTVFQLSLTLSGTAPWDVTYTDGTTNWTVSGIGSSPHVFDVDEAPVWIDPGTPLSPRQMTYQVVDVTSGTCTTTPAGSVDVWIFKQPETGPAYHVPNEWE